MIVTRFAPSPTGYLHLGHAFAALTAFETARTQGGRFLLRIEDIDSARARAEFTAAICEDLRWLGLAWDAPVTRQSERFDAYRAALHALEEKELLYPCFCTRRDIETEIARAAEAPHGPEGPRYPGTCKRLSREEATTRIGSGSSYALRLDVQKASAQIGRLGFEEHGRGPHGEHGCIDVDPLLFGDVVIARKEFPASYHLCVTVDDAAQGVTLVTRGSDLFSATHVQRTLQALLGLPQTAYAHHRLILDEDAKKLSKRDQALTLRAMRDSGISPEAVRTRLGF